MRKLTILLVVCALSVYCYDVRSQFDKYIEKYNKPYKNDREEYENRLQNFEDSLRRIKELQERSPSANFGLNKFSDMSPNEFRSRRLTPGVTASTLATSCLAKGVVAPRLDTSDLPTSFDWRSKGVVNPVKDQLECGSCWAFSTISVIESQWALSGHNLTSFSEQLLVDCSSACSIDDGYNVCNSGCDGGWQWNAYVDIMSWQGVETETEYPYTGEDGNCSRNAKFAVAPIKNYTCLSGPVSPYDEGQMAAYLVNYGPIAIAMNASLLFDYDSGIIVPSDNDCGGEVLDHALVVVGFGQQNVPGQGMVPFWIIRNSWGADWGENGYFRLIRGSGACGVNNAVSSVVM